MKKLLALILAVLLFASPAGAAGYTFNAIDSAIHATDSDIQLTTFTLCIWTRRTGDGEGSQGTIAHASSAGFWTFKHQGANYVFDEASMGGRWTVVEPLVNVVVHICLAYDGSSTANNPVIWFDGVSQSVTETSAPSGTFTVPQQWVWGNLYDFSRTWAGDLGDAAIWGRILTTAQVNTAMRYGPKWVSNGKPLSYLPMGRFGSREYGTAAISWTPEGTLTSNNSGGPRRSSPAGGFIFMGR